MSNTKTKLVNVTQIITKRYEYSAVVRVPEDFDQSKREALIEALPPLSG